MKNFFSKTYNFLRDLPVLVQVFSIICTLAITATALTVTGFEYFHRARNSSHEGQQILRAREYRKEGLQFFKDGRHKEAQERYSRAVTIFQSLSDDGNKLAKFELAKHYCIGWGVPKNERLSRHYFEKSEPSDEQIERMLSISEFESCISSIPPKVDLD